jgi:hypothetical protein
VTTIARRAKPLPKLLRDKAAESGREPRTYLVDVLGEWPTNEDAARSIGVTRNTLWRWCRLLDVRVEVTA